MSILFLSPVFIAQHSVCGNTKSQFLSPLRYLSHLHVPGLSDISDVERNLSELSVTSSADSGFKGSGHSFRFQVPGSPIRCKCAKWACVCTNFARDFDASTCTCKIPRRLRFAWYTFTSWLLHLFFPSVLLSLSIQIFQSQVSKINASCRSFHSHGLCFSSCIFP